MATRSGLCFGRPDTTPTVEVVRAPVTGEDYGAFANFYFKYFTRLLDRLETFAEPEELILVCFEAPLLPREKWDPVKKKMVGQTQIATTRKLHSLGVILELCCVLHAEKSGRVVEVRECTLSTLKKELGGAGDASKADMVFVARRAGIALPEGEEAKDGADAFAAWLLAMRHRAPKCLSAWDKRLYSPMGARS